MAQKDKARRRREAIEANRASVRIGQVWQDNDSRMGERRVRVMHVGETHAWCRIMQARGEGMRTTNIRIDRFKPTSTGWKLILSGREGGEA